MVKKADVAIARFEGRFAKLFGEGTLVADEAESPYKVIPTGSITLDYYLGVGGWVRGRLAEVWGADDIGKTTLMLQGTREAQRVVPERRVLWIDMEQKWDWPWARAHGVNVTADRFRLYVPNSAEDVADAIKEALRSGLFSLIVLDSIGAMIPEKDKEKEAGETVVASLPKVVTRMVQIAAVEARKSETALVLINQVRANVSGFGKATTTGGGWALKHATTQKIEMKSTGAQPLKIRQDDTQVQVGREVACYIDRNKVAQAKRTAFLTLIATPTERYGPVGVDLADEAATMGLRTGVIAQSGGWYTITPTEQRYQGRDTLVAALRDDPEAIDTVRDRVLATIAGEVRLEDEADAEETEDAGDRDGLGGDGPSFRTGPQS